MNSSRTLLGGLDCRILDWLPEGAGPSLVVVFCHGFGAPGTDLVPLAGELVAIEPRLADAVRFVFPAAPLTLDPQGLPGGRAWWMIDLDKLVAAVERGETRSLHESEPQGLSDAREMLLSLIDDLTGQTGLPISRVVLGGFSQGAMLTTDVALRLPERPAGLCIFSGTLVNEAEWLPRAAKRGPLPVVQSHGTQDPLLSFAAAESLRDALTGAGLAVDFVAFQGMHSIPAEGLRRAARLIAACTTQTSNE